MEKPVLGTHETDTQPRRIDVEAVGVEPGVRGGVGYDDVGRAKRRAIDPPQGATRERRRREPPAVADERVVEGHERVEDNRPAACRNPRSSKIEMTRVANEQRIRRLAA